MTRRLFGGETSVQDELGNVFSNQANKGNVWDAATGGTAVIDLTDAAGNPITSVSTDAHGQYLFHGPDDGTAKLWIDFGFGRYLTEATDTTDRLATLEVAVGAGAGVAGGVAGPLDSNGDLPITQLPTGVIGGAATTDAAGQVPETQLPVWVPGVIQYANGAWPQRTTLPFSATRMVIWKGPTDPTFNAGYALASVDVWLQET